MSAPDDTGPMEAAATTIPCPPPGVDGVDCPMCVSEPDVLKAVTGVLCDAHRAEVARTAPSLADPCGAWPVALPKPLPLHPHLPRLFR